MMALFALPHVSLKVSDLVDKAVEYCYSIASKWPVRIVRVSDIVYPVHMSVEVSSMSISVSFGVVQKEISMDHLVQQGIFHVGV